MKKKIKPGYLIALAVILISIVLAFTFLDSLAPGIQASAMDIEASPEAAAHTKSVATGRSLGVLSLIPAVITVLMAFITREVVSSLFLGLLSGYIILEAVSGAYSGFLGYVGGILREGSQGILNTATDSFHGSILILCLCIGGTVSVINMSGGFAALGKKITRNINSPKRATLMAQIMGMCLFFDDYANSLITGPVMRSITDKQGVSREKLAYIVDSTAAPVAGIAIISSWIAAELSAIENGFAVAGVSGSAYAHFLGSIPFCFYNFIAIALVLATTLMGREYGPMLKAERRARQGEPLKNSTASFSEEKTDAELRAGSIWTAIIPIAILIVYAIVGFYTDGIAAAKQAGLVSPDAGFSFSLISTAFGNADTVTILMRASILSSLAAIFLGCVSRRLTLVSAIEAWVKGVSGIVLTAVILVLAWSLSAVIGKLGAAYYLVDIVSINLPYWLLPMLIFLVCCAISFAAGSFGCMVIVMPIAVPLAYSSVAVSTIPYGEQFIFACIAAVLSGSIFGDHCSPVTDTTILSSLGAGCDNLDHVKTQLPYALTSAAAASLFGYLPAGLGVSPLISIPAGLLVGILAVRFVGKKVVPLTKASSLVTDK